MTFKVPNRAEAINRTRDLINGVKSNLEVGLWASEIFLPYNKELDQKLEDEDPKLHEYLEILGLAAELNIDGTPLYIVEDYESWLEEFLVAIDEDNKPSI